MPVLTIGIVRDCFYLLIFYSEKFSTWVWRLPFAVIVNLSDKSENQEILPTFSQPYPCVSSFRPFFGQISLPFHKLQLVKSPPLFGRSLPVWAVKGRTSPPPPFPDDFKVRTDWILVSLGTPLFTDLFIPVLPCLLPVPDRVVPLRMCWTYRRSKGKMVLSSVSKPDETTEKRRTT